jgi:L-asparaginase II
VRTEALPASPHAVLAEVVRNGLVESVHYGSAIVLDTAGRVQHSFGPIDAPVYGRSSNKPFQGVAMLELGLDLHNEELAVAVASHSAEQFHLEVVERILSAVRLSVDDLQCVVDPPYSPAVARRLWQTGGVPSRLTMNCSGKHAAMLATCVINDWDTRSYLDVGHPLTTHITAVIGRLTGLSPMHIGVDGCGAPAHALSVASLARGFAALATSAGGTPESRVAHAMRSFPLFVAGTDREDSLLMPRIPGLICKEGAEGVQVAAMPDGRAVALKILDGTPRARLAILIRLLELAGVDVNPASDLRNPAVLGGGRPVGHVRCVL